MRVLRATDNQKKKKASKIVIKDFFFINYNQGMHEKKIIKICIHIHGLAMQDMARKAKLAPLKLEQGKVD